jgi:LytS/YehU family sensor histidine kinase
MLLVYGALYWVLPPMLDQKYRLFIRRLAFYILAGILLNFFLMGYVLLPYKTGRITLFPDYRKVITLLPWLNGMMVAGILVSLELYRFWSRREQANQQLARETLAISLQVLKAQVHPHFLFNTLNNIYSLTLRKSPVAPHMVQELLDLLHYMVQECNTPTVLLAQEIQFIRNYIALEKRRYGPRLRVQVNIQSDSDAQQIEPLLLISFVENAFKHGAAKQVGQSLIELTLLVTNNQLTFSVYNSVDLSHALYSPRAAGIGLANVQKRLSLLYPNAHSLLISHAPGRFTVELTLQLKPQTRLSPVEPMAAPLFN